MGQENNKNSISKEQLIIAFVLVSSLLIVIDIGKNLADEVRIASELKSLSTELEKPHSTITPTLSEKEMNQWTDRLKKRADT